MRDHPLSLPPADASPQHLAAASRRPWLAHPGAQRAWRIGHGSAIGALLVLFLSVATEQVYPTSVQVSVSATVLKKVWARVLQSPPGIVVTEPDRARGWLDVAQPTVLVVRNNSQDGFLLAVEADPDLVARVAVSGLPQGTAEFGPTGGFVTQPGSFRSETRIDLRWRLYLARQAGPGAYPWPVALHVQAN